jgi:aminopeptidase N
LFFAVPSSSQRLPKGKLNTNRERQFDILHYKAEIALDLPNKQVVGTVTIRLSPFQHLSAISLDAIRLDVKRVTAPDLGPTALSFQSRDQKLGIELPKVLEPNEEIKLVVEYDCQPKSGMYIRPHPQNPELYYVSTYGEGGKHANWLPIYNDVNDRFSSEMLVTVPDPYVAISNGRLVGETPGRDGSKTYHWLQEEAHPNYLIALYIGDFEKGDLPSAFGEIPLSFWVPRGSLEQGSYTFRNTTRMVEFFSNRFDYRYPWVKYDQVVIPDFAAGAMEHTGITGHQASILRDPGSPVDFAPVLDHYASEWTAESIISHELAHHWFGNLITCRNLSYLWLNESFASYLMMLWDEELLGKEQLLFDVHLARESYLDYVNRAHIIRPLEYHYFDDTNTIYNFEHTYFKGAAVLHMLRSALGDPQFFGALSHYLHKHEQSNTESGELKIALEEATGRNLDWFFEDWVYGGGHPVFEVSYRFRNVKELLSLSVRQVQPVVESQDLFTLPLRITIHTPSKILNETIWVKEESETFFFEIEEAPLFVSFDGAGDLVADIRFPKKRDDLLAQARLDSLAGRIRALRALAADHPTDSKTLAIFNEVIGSNDFWALQAEAARLLGSLRTDGAEKLAARALQSQDYRVRKAAVLGLTEFGTPGAVDMLKEIVGSDPQSDVVAAALVALAKADAGTPLAFFTDQMARSSWDNEIVQACLTALGVLGRPELASTIRPYTAPSYNMRVRGSALTAWAKCMPEDQELHRTLIDLTESPVYALQQQAISMLGQIQVSQAQSALRSLVEENADANLVVAAKAALREIQLADEWLVRKK